MNRHIGLHLFTFLCFWLNHYVPVHYVRAECIISRCVMRAIARVMCWRIMRAFARTMPAMGHALRARRGTMASTQWLQTKHYQLE